VEPVEQVVFVEAQIVIGHAVRSGHKKRQQEAHRNSCKIPAWFSPVRRAGKGCNCTLPDGRMTVPRYTQDSVWTKIWHHAFWLTAAEQYLLDLP
jgi:hypothetical protein